MRLTLSARQMRAVLNNSINLAKETVKWQALFLPRRRNAEALSGKKDTRL
jgi:hypothetical protein